MKSEVRDSMTDGELLSRFARSGCEDSFRQLVDRYLPLVRGVALRKTGRPEMAEELAMEVFAAAAQKAEALAKRSSLGGWLLVAARLAANQALRKDATRRRYMKILRDQSDRHVPEDDRFWDEISPLLDDALASLHDLDREAVVLHFYRKLPYREVGKRLGRGEDAARKRVNRALEKMGAYFRRRGTVVAVGILSAALGSRLAEAKTGIGAASIATEALASTTAQGSLFGISPSLLLMTQNKSLNAIGASVAAVVLSTGTGFVIGHHRGDLHRGRIAAAIALSPPPDNPSLVSGSSSPAGATPPGEKGATTLRELLSRMAAAAGETGRRSTAWIELQELGDSIRPEQFREAIRIVQQEHIQDPKITATLTSYLISGWARYDGEAAANETLARDEAVEQRLGGVFTAWAGYDPEGAREWLEENGTRFGDGLRIRLQGNLFNGWVATNPEPAIDAFERLPYDEQRDIVRRLWSATRDEEIRGRFFERVSRIPDERLRAEIFDQSIVDALDAEPALAGQAYDALKFTEPGVRWRAIDRAATAMYAEDPAGTVRWVWERAPVDRREDVIRRWITSGWANHDRESAETWLREQGYDPGEWLEADETPSNEP